MIARYIERGWQRDFYLPGCWLDPDGANVIAVAVRNAPESGGLYEASVEPYSKFSVKQNEIEINW